MAISNQPFYTYEDHIAGASWAAHATAFRLAAHQFALDRPGILQDAANGPADISITLMAHRPQSHFGKHGLRKGAPLTPAVDMRKILDGVIMAGHQILWDRSQFKEIFARATYGPQWGFTVRVTIAKQEE